ncbi:FAD-dependent monooxygenase [Umezawaea endophytica]|uniref:FAD-dependent monooxygenase n=1 Tax=Umezawaea endophytica TaxID=1654476 RepID=A0A9X3AGM1_9PSEU|nr:FAD-dependent monooxygenase [Umezawaea endophytica]MCS7480287.1 FAD-dependent monooxygenase [Umezawaea endophytica]
MDNRDYDVLVAGGGPVGLALAAELRLAGVSVAVLERLTEPSGLMKAGGIQGRATQMLARRGLRARLDAEAEQAGFAAFLRDRADGRPPEQFAGHFAGLLLRLDPDFDLPRGTLVKQPALERLLGEWVRELDVPVARGHEITGFTQDEDGVTVRATTADGEVTLRGGYLVGCDGGRSTVRKLAGFDFPGTEPVVAGCQAVVTMDHPERLPLGWNFTDTGVYVHGPTPGRVVTMTFDGPPADRGADLTAAEVQESLRHVSGVDVTVTAVEATSRFTDNNRQATTYRAGRVLLAGDAAHVHPAFGGQGLNLGLSDAANLGWKLAATVRGWAPDGLLDTYTAERHPVAARALANTRAQVAIMRPDAQSRAMRELFADLLQAPGATERLVNSMHGLDIRYGADPDAHPLTGRHVPDLPGVEDAMRLPRPVLFDLRDSAGLRAAADGWTDRVDVRVLTGATGPAALLVRPDGHVAWAADGEVGADDLDALRHALSTWFGKPWS